MLIANSTKIEKSDEIIEIGPGTGNLTKFLVKLNPKNIFVIEKDENLVKNLSLKFGDKINIINKDILKFFDKSIFTNETIVVGNLPYNISSQILVKMIKFKKWPPNFYDLIFMFQKELGEKIIGLYQTPNYGRISILANSRLKVIKKFFVSPNCFRPKPKITSMVIHFQPKSTLLSIKDILNLEKVKKIFFSNKRKMINKNIKKIFKNDDKIKLFKNIDIKSRPSDLSPEHFYEITRLFPNAYIVFDIAAGISEQNMHLLQLQIIWEISQQQSLDLTYYYK